MRRALAAVVALAAAAAVLAGTARGDFADPKKQHTAADMALARTIVPKLSDLPAGWKATRSTDSSSDNSFTCAGFKPNLSDLVETGYAESPDLSMGQSNLVSGFAAVFRTGPQATAAYARVIKPALSRCLRVLFEKESTKALKVHVLSVRQSPVGSVQARADAYRITARFTGSGVSLLAHLDFVFLQRGRAVAGVLVLRFPQPVDPRLEARVVGAIDRRSAAA